MTKKIDLQHHACLQHTDAMKAIAHPLSLLNIDYFCYTSIDLTTGDRYLLTDHPEWSRVAYKSGFYDSDFSRRVEMPGIYETFLGTEFAEHPLFKLANQHGLCSGITLLNTLNNRLEVNYFYSNHFRDDQYYIDLKPYFKQFIPYFKDAAQDLIQDVAKHPFSVREFDPTLDGLQRHAVDPKDLSEYLDALNVNRLVLNDAGEYLTHREALCVYFFIKGETAKATALELNISHRTVETHILNVRRKLNIGLGRGLIGALIESPYFAQIVSYGSHVTGQNPSLASVEF